MTGLDEAHPTRRNNERTVAGRHRMMRRADREVTDCEQIEGIVAACRIVHVGYADAEGLTIVPLNFGYEWQQDGDAGTGDELAGLTLYIHSASIGRKLDAIRAAGNALDVAFSMETDCEVIAGRTPCNWGEAFKSVIGNGVASMIDDLDECRKGLRLLMGQQAGMPDIDCQVAGRGCCQWAVPRRHCARVPSRCEGTRSVTVPGKHWKTGIFLMCHCA